MYRDQSREYRLVLVSRSVETFGVGGCGEEKLWDWGRVGQIAA